MPLYRATTNIASSQSTLSANFTITAANGTFEDTGLSITLPSAGTYLIFGNVRAVVFFTAGTGGFISAKLFNSTDSADVADSERIIALVVNASDGLQLSTGLTQRVTVTASKTIKLYAKRDNATTWVDSIIASDANGRTSLGYVKLSA